MAREKLGWLCSGLIVLASGCGGGGGNAPASTTSTTPVVAPAITAQPVDLSVPMGLTATYSITATGTAPQYQWSRDGVAIPGANQSQYVTPATGFGDTGASFTVTATNSAGTATSDAATLTVTARAPKPGDLRFQLVDSDLTVNGYGNAGAGLSTNLLRGEQTFTGSLGTPLHADISTIYEAQVTTVSPADAATAAANLASQGYIITAVGLADSTADIVMVGTRVQGDTMPRPFMSVAQGSGRLTMFQQGYATVGIISYPSPTVANTYVTTLLGER
jgi:hypothetical protein